ncbi:MAG: tetratricopeptide repeat protein [Planctomycetaceae bacterium]|nr:MAG: tetratricopeptide repeat protein [Planctomycetaceae bacterium]
MSVQEKLSRAWQAHQAGRVEEAEAVYRQVLAHYPQHAATHVYLGIAQFDRRRFAESAESYRTALRFQPQFAIAWNNLGNSLRMMGQTDAADECFGRALEQQPDYVSPLKNRGTLWIWAGQIQRGLDAYREALRLVPEDAELHRNLGVIYLLLQRYEEGWPEYRYRWHFLPHSRVADGGAVWRGEDPQGKVFLLYPEQGIGDAIHFIRAAQTIRRAGGRTILQCDPKLIPLFSSVGGIDLMIPDGVPVSQFGAPPIDYQASLIDVIDHWHGRTGELATEVPAVEPGRPEYLRVSDSLVDYWRRGLTIPGPRVGICWQGNPEFHADVYRSIPLAEFAPLARIPGVSLVSLQFGFGREQADQVPFASSIHRLPETIDRSGGAFMDTAAIIRNLDLVITIDTSTAHLAAALGVPVWLLLGKVPDWRWLQEGDSTDWYPTIRIFRQQRMGHWGELLERVAMELGEWAAVRAVSR